MTRLELLAELRAVLADTVGPRYGWSDDRLMNFLSEGQDKFCEQTGFWLDRSTYTIVTEADTLDYDLDPRIIEVIAARDGIRKLIEYGEESFADNNDTSFADTSPQRPQFYRLDGDTGTLSLLSPPEAGIVINLRVHRYSLVAFNTKNASNQYTVETPEIPSRFHLAMVEYAAAKAFGDHDRELQDPVKAGEHMKNFRQYVREGGEAFRRLTRSHTTITGTPEYVV